MQHSRQRCYPYNACCTQEPPLTPVAVDRGGLWTRTGKLPTRTNPAPPYTLKVCASPALLTGGWVKESGLRAVMTSLVAKIQPSYEMWVLAACHPWGASLFRNVYRALPGISRMLQTKPRVERHWRLDDLGFMCLKRTSHLGKMRRRLWL